MRLPVNRLWKFELMKLLCVLMLFAAFLMPPSVQVTWERGVEVGLSQAHAQGFTDFAENKISDAFARGQSLVFPSTWYLKLSTTTCTGDVTGTEVSTSGTNYARASYTPSLTSWSGTQAAGSTTASSGTGGVTSNNGLISFNVPSASWGSVQSVEWMDALTAGNSWMCANLSVVQTISTGNTVSFAISSLSVTVQ